MMSRIWKRAPAKLLLAAVAAGVLAAPVWAADPGRPGTVNYVEGHVMLQGETLNSQSIGSAEMQAGQVLETQQGRAEILLTPGVFFRVGDNSQVRMISPDLIATRVELIRGEASLEADGLLKGTNVQVVDKGASITIEKSGLYEFTSDPPQVRVYDGKAEVAEDGNHIDVGKGHQALLYGRLHAARFNAKQADSLYAWSNVRSESLAEASMASARTYVGGAYDPGWFYGAGWYWNPWYSMYSFIPGDGIWYSPFGWGFYAPTYIWHAPFYGGGFRGPHYRGPIGGFRPGGFAATPRGFSGGFHGGGFHGGGGRR